MELSTGKLQLLYSYFSPKENIITVNKVAEYLLPYLIVNYCAWLLKLE